MQMYYNFCIKFMLSKSCAVVVLFLPLYVVFKVKKSVYFSQNFNKLTVCTICKQHILLGELVVRVCRFILKTVKYSHRGQHSSQ